MNRRFKLALSTILGTQLLLLTALVPALALPSQRRRKGAPAKKTQPSWPSFEARRAEFLDRVRSASAAGIAAPEPLSQFLVSEIVVTGIFETENGYGVFVHAIPNGRTFDARPGSELYNGRLVDIVVPGGFIDEGSIVFSERPVLAGPERSTAKRIEKAPERLEPAQVTAPPSS